MGSPLLFPVWLPALWLQLPLRARLGLFMSALKPVSVTGVENKQGIILKLPCPVLCWGSRWAGTSRVQLLQIQVLLVQKLPSNPGLFRGCRPASGPLKGRPSHWAGEGGARTLHLGWAGNINIDYLGVFVPHTKLSTRITFTTIDPMR